MRVQHLPSTHPVSVSVPALVAATLFLFGLAVWDPGIALGWPAGAVTLLLSLPLVFAVSLHQSSRAVWAMAIGTAVSIGGSLIVRIAWHEMPVTAGMFAFPLSASVCMFAMVAMLRKRLTRLWEQQHDVLNRVMAEKNAWQRRCHNLSANETQREFSDGVNIDFANLLMWMREVGQRVAGHYEPSTLHPAIIGTTQTLLRSPDCRLFLWDNQEKCFTPSAARNPKTASVPQLLRNHRVIRWLHDERRILTRDRFDEEETIRGSVDPVDVPDAIAPLCVGGELLGILLVDGINRLTPQANRLLYVVCGLSALGLKNCELVSQVHDLARRDSLTGLLNHGSVIEELRQKTQMRSARCSLIISDLDNFKRFNDVHGHQAGDYVLRETAKLWATVAPESAPIGRYGGEEFVCVLPGKSIDDAVELAERLRSTMQHKEWEFAGKNLNVTASFGVAEFGYPAADVSELIRLADTALYRAKHAGRNRVEIATLADSQERSAVGLPSETLEVP